MPVYKGANSVVNKPLIINPWTLSLPLPTGVSVSVGDLVVVHVVDGTSVNAAPTVSDSGGNTYTAFRSLTAMYPAAGHADLSVFYTFATSPVNAGTNITVTWSGSAEVIVLSVHVFAPDSGASFLAPSDKVEADRLNTTPAISTTATLAANTVLIAGIVMNGPNGDTWTEDTDTTAGSWSSGKSATGPSMTIGTTGQGATSNISIRQQYKITTSSSVQQLDIVLGTSRPFGLYAIWFPQTQPVAGDTFIDAFGARGFYGI